MAASDVAVAERLAQVKNEIAAKSAQDSMFRASLLNNPGKTIEEEYGLDPGALSNIKLKVVEEEAGSIVIPIPPDISALELTDEQLDQVAGGAAFIGTMVVGLATLAVTTASATRGGRRW